MSLFQRAFTECLLYLDNIFKVTFLQNVHSYETLTAWEILPTCQSFPFCGVLVLFFFRNAEINCSYSTQQSWQTGTQLSQLLYITAVLDGAPKPLGEWFRSRVHKDPVTHVCMPRKGGIFCFTNNRRHKKGSNRNVLSTKKIMCIFATFWQEMQRLQ